MYPFCFVFDLLSAKRTVYDLSACSSLLCLLSFKFFVAKFSFVFGFFFWVLNSEAVTCEQCAEISLCYVF